MAVRELRTNYGLVPVRDFGPLSLQAVQRGLAESDHSRVYVNCLIDIVRRIFKWGVAQEMVAETIYRALDDGSRTADGPHRRPRAAADPPGHRGRD